MSLSVVSGASQSLYQFLQRLSSNPQTQEAASTSTTSAAGSTAGTTTGQAVQKAGHHHHGHGGGAMFKKIESAVTDALQSAQADGSSDPNKTIEDAIAKVFQQNGATTPAAGGTANADGDQDASAASQGPGQSDATARQAFFQTLKGYGIDPQQFRKDLMAAMQDAKGGSTDASTAFKSFPPGMAVDTLG